MWNLISKIQRYLRRRKYKIVLQDREELSDYEKDLLIPELKSRLSSLKDYFQSIVDLCETHKTDILFAALIKPIVNPDNMPSRGENEKEFAERYFTEIQKIAKEQHTDEIDKILASFQKIDDLKTFVKFLNEVNVLCSSLVEVNNQLFLYRLQAFPHLVNIESNKLAGAAEPIELNLTIKPFEITVSNIVSVAKATSDTIHSWHKQFMEGKTRFLEYYGYRVSLRINTVVLLIQIFALLLGIVFSAFFLTANDPFNLFKKNLALGQQSQQLSSDFEQCTEAKNKNERQLLICQTQLKVFVP